MLGSSRGMNLPNNLQGIWNADNTPPWECDIHSNINIQMNYWPAEITNLPECHLPFLQYIAVEAVGKPNGSWRRIAQGGLRGWTIKHRIIYSVILTGISIVLLMRGTVHICGNIMLIIMIWSICAILLSRLCKVLVSIGLTG